MIRGVLNRFLVLLGGHELAVLLAFAGIACGIWLFAGLAGEVMEGETQAVDQRLLLALRHPGDLSPLGPPSVQDAARDVTALGGVTVLTLLTVVTGGFLLLDGKKHMALFVYGSVAGELSGAVYSKTCSSALGRAPWCGMEPCLHGTSFPSGHSMMSAVTYLTLGALLARSHQRKRLKAYFLLLAALLTCLVGISRVYLGVHWPTDVLAGWTAGASWAIFCWLVARWLQGRHAIEAENESASEDG